MERETGFAPATSSLARKRSTTELLPLSSHNSTTLPATCKPATCQASLTEYARDVKETDAKTTTAELAGRSTWWPAHSTNHQFNFAQLYLTAATNAESAHNRYPNRPRQARSQAGSRSKRYSRRTTRLRHMARSFGQCVWRIRRLTLPSAGVLTLRALLR